MAKRQQKKIDPADLLTPDELLVGANSLLLYDEPLFMRAVVLEAYAALETYVKLTIDEILNNNPHAEYVNLIEEVRKDRIDERIGILTDVGIGQPLSRQGNLWNNFKRVQEIRNQTTHLGYKVNHQLAQFVVTVIHDLLAFLGSTAEVDLSLLGLKKFIEREKISIANEQECVSIVKEYYMQTKSAVIKTEKSLVFHDSRMIVDILLKFGEYTIQVETKFSSFMENFDTIYDSVVEKALSNLNLTQISRAAIIIFTKGQLSESFNKVKTTEDGRISIIAIKV